MAVSLRTVQRSLDRGGVGKAFQLKAPRVPGTLVIHSIPILWRKEDGAPPRRSMLLCIAEANTGFAFLNGYERIKDVSLYSKIGAFEKRFQAPIVNVVVCTERGGSGAGEKIIATAIRKPVVDLLGELVRDRVEGQDFEISADDPTPRMASSVEIPGVFESMDHLNKTLHKLVDYYNRGYGPYGKKQPHGMSCFAPAEFLWRIVGPLTDKAYTRKATFYRKIKFS